MLFAFFFVEAFIYSLIRYFLKKDQILKKGEKGQIFPKFKKIILLLFLYKFLYELRIFPPFPFFSLGEAEPELKYLLKK